MDHWLCNWYPCLNCTFPGLMEVFNLRQIFENSIILYYSCNFSYSITKIHSSVGPVTWWRHQMESFSALLAICAGNSPVPGEFPTQRPVTRSFDVFFDLRLNKRLSKQSWGWWFGTLSRPLWRHCNDHNINIDNNRDVTLGCTTHRKDPSEVSKLTPTGVGIYTTWRTKYLILVDLNSIK